MLILTNQLLFLITCTWDALNVNVHRTKFWSSTEKCSYHNFLYTHSVSHAHFSDTCSLCGVQTSRTRMAQGVCSAHVACLHLAFSVLMFTSRPPFRLRRPRLPCRTVPDPKAWVKRTSARAAKSLATWPIPRSPQVMSPRSYDKISDFSKITRENTALFGVSTMLEASVSHVSRGESKRQHASGNRCWTEREREKKEKVL